ncbi:hypothetical protein U9M48_037273 [Paspalum notatum var. saurae]|uniref:Protein kinase domain-containing protein n=1 Tax=Paspalum notatum var. saurae TaxID=547442 RepID=A0AAQ3UFA5_PASNO
MDLPENKLRGYIQDNGKPMWTAHNNHNIRYFREEEIRIITSNYSTLLGKGAFGEVYKGVLDDNSSVAVKRYIHNVKDNFAKEVIVHCHINHRNVIRLIGCCIGENSLMMVTEYMSKGNLSDILHCSEITISLETRLGIAIGCAKALSYTSPSIRALARVLLENIIYVVYVMPRSYRRLCCIHARNIFPGQNMGILGWEIRSAIALSAARAVAYIHSTDVVAFHGNINSSNILLTRNREARVSEHGLKTLVFPTSVTNNNIAQKDDVYSFGVVLLEMITGKSPIHMATYLLDCVLKTPREQWATKAFDQKLLAKNPDLRQLLKLVVEQMTQFLKFAIHCCDKNPALRPAMSEVVQQIEEIRGSTSGDRQFTGNNVEGS